MGVDADRAEQRGRRTSTAPRRSPPCAARRARASRPRSPRTMPSSTKNSVYIQPMLATRQSQVVVNSSCTSVMSGHAFGARQPERARQRQPEHAEAVGHADAEMNAKRRRRHQPAIEAGGRNRPLFVRNPVPAPGMLPALLISCHRYFPLQPTVVLGVFAVFDPVSRPCSGTAPSAVPCHSGTRWDRHAHSRIHSDVLIMLAAMPAN